MTKKEIDIQRALGTLPLWLKIKHGEAAITNMLVTFNRNILGRPVFTRRLMRLECENITATYDSNNPHGRQEAIERMIQKAKLLRL